MKKICVALGVLFMAIASALADDNVLVKTASSISTKSSGEISTDSIYWTFPGSVGLNVNQAYFNEYSMEGTGLSVSSDAFVNLNANYKKNRVKWDNSFAAKYGFIYSDQFASDSLRKNMDEFGLYSKFGYKMAKYWYSSALASLESQFTNGYKYDPLPSGKDTAILNSSFFAPGYVKVSLGFDYVPNKYISLFMSPLTTRFTICRLNELAPNYGMELIEGTANEYKKSRSELGAYAILRSDFDITKNIHFFSSLEAFYAYNKAVSTYTHGYAEDWFGKIYNTIKSQRESINLVRGTLSNIHNMDYSKEDMPEDMDKLIISLSDKGELTDEDMEILLDSKTYESSYSDDLDINKFIHGWYFKWKLELMMKLTKYINVSVRTQFKYDNAEMKTIEGKYYGLPHANIQIWEALSIGIAYQF
ncbi:MAG: DUF3078 domain-containing protein [Paludibacteraceae bacterium]|nr:DUF3078 domain-containing protein [Paludibacteraceae bacterium]